MATLLWGGLFLFLSLYTFMASLIALQLLRRSVKEAPNFHLAPPLPEADTGAFLRFRALVPAPLPPGFRTTLVIELVHSPTRRSVVRHKLPPLVTQVDVPLKLPRGAYQTQFFLEARDVWGFTAVSRPFPGQERVSFIPGLVEAPRPQFIPRGTGTKPDRSRKVRTQDLLEVRKYHPGDDIRKIHWGLYAHLGEPFLRIGEETPPPSGKLFFVVDPSFPRHFHPESVLDLRLSMTAHFLTHTAQPWVTFFPQAEVPGVEFPRESLDQWARTAARLQAGEPDLGLVTRWVQNSPHARELAAATVLVISAPGCPGLASLSSELTRLKIASRPFLFPLPDPREKTSSPWWRRPPREVTP